MFQLFGNLRQCDYGLVGQKGIQGYYQGDGFAHIDIGEFQILICYPEVAVYMLFDNEPIRYESDLFPFN
jgi:hypothetical protein